MVSFPLDIKQAHGNKHMTVVSKEREEGRHPGTTALCQILGHFFLFSSDLPVSLHVAYY